MNPTPRTMTDEDKKLIDEYLKNGGEISKKPAFARTEDIVFTSGFYGRKKKKVESKDE